MPAIDLLRHGDTGITGRYLGRTDAPLNDAGWAQLRAATAGLQPWQRIVSSPLQRCAAFAHELAQARQLPLEIDARWQEMHFGEWENRLTCEIMDSDPDRLRRFWESPQHHSPPQGESLPAVVRRVTDAWNDIVRRDIPTLVVTHGGPIRIVRCLTEQMPLVCLFTFDVPHAGLHRIAAAAVIMPP